MAGPFGPIGETDPRDELADLIHKSGFLFGPRAKGLVTSGLTKAKELARKGADYKDTNYETGWWRHPVDQGWRTEVPEDQFVIQPLMETQKARQRPLWQTLDAPKLFQAYPGLRDVSTDMKLVSDAKDLGGYYQYDPNFKDFDRAFNMRGPMYRNPLEKEEPYGWSARDVTAHEVAGHGVQHTEDWARGSHPSMVRELMNKGDPAVTKGMVEHDIPDALRSLGLDVQFNPTSAASLKAAVNDPIWGAPIRKEAVFRQYQRSSGEEEANNMVRRLGMTADQIRDKPWWETFSIPFDRQQYTPQQHKLPRKVGGW